MAVSISLVIPLYQVEPYLPALLASLSAQVPGPYTVEHIFVDDGSTDRSAELADAWLAAGGRGRLIRQANAGVCAARNAGIEAATGTWISFPDSDDYLHPEYLLRIAEFLESSRGERAVVVAANIHKFIEATDEVVDNHSLRFKFKGKAKNVDLVASPHYVQMSAATAFFRTAGLPRFIVGLHGSEDALFVSTVMATAAEPVLGIVPAAIYYYRKRASADSAVDTYTSRPQTYFDRFEDGYLPLLERIAGPDGTVPGWLANQVLYELRWLFGRELDPATRSRLGEADSQRVLTNTARMLARISDEAILGYRTTSVPHHIRMLWLQLKGSPLPEPRVHVTALDEEARQLQLRYLYAGSRPAEEFRVRAQVVEPVHAKTATLEFFGQRRLFERVVWLPATSWLAVKLDGRSQQLGLGAPERVDYALTEVQIWRHFGASTLVGKPWPAPASDIPAGAPTLEQAVAAASRLLTRRRFADAWVFSGDTELLCRAAQRDQNCWYVTAEPRKVAGLRTVTSGSPEHLQLMLNAVRLVTTEPSDLKPVPAGYHPDGRPWRATLIGPANPLPLDGLVDQWLVATPDDAAALAGDGTPGPFTTKEVAVAAGVSDQHTAIAGS